MEWTHIEKKWSAMACRLQHTRQPGEEDLPPDAPTMSLPEVQEPLSDPLQDDVAARVTA
jgi:hypothetical protein